MEQVVEKNKNIQNVAKIVKKLKIKEPSLKQFSIKLATEYMNTDEKIKQLEISKCKEVEEECIDGLYKQHITINTEPKMENFYNRFNYENLMEKYEEKVDKHREEREEIIGARSKKELIHTEKAKIIDMLSRQFASAQFEKIKLVDVADLTKREIEKLYKNSKEIIEEELEEVVPEEREILKDNHLGKLQFVMTNFLYEKENKVQEELPQRHTFKIWEWIKHFFRPKQPKLLEEGVEEKREKKLEKLKDILMNTYYETEFAGCFKSGKMDDRVHIMQVDEANVKDKDNISERREMLKEEILVTL